MKGIPGIQLQRLQEAMRIRHCALSLVGEPITCMFFTASDIDMFLILHRPIY